MTDNPNTLYIPASIADRVPSMVRNELSKMSAQYQEEFVEEFKRKSKSIAIAYILLLFVFTLHYAYVRKWGLQILFWLTFGGFFIWWFIDLFRLPGIIRDYNKDTAVDIMRNLKAIRG